MCAHIEFAWVFNEETCEKFVLPSLTLIHAALISQSALVKLRKDLMS